VVLLQWLLLIVGKKKKSGVDPQDVLFAPQKRCKALKKGAGVKTKRVVPASWGKTST